MVTLTDLEDYLIDFLQVAEYKDFCPNGVQVEGASRIEHLATAVTASLETIQEAVSMGVDALLVHHGLFWKGDEPTIKGTQREKIRLLIENDISLLAYHLPLDGHPEVGNNWAAARELQWRNLEPFGDGKGPAIGVKANFDELEIEEFQSLLETYYQHKAHVAFGGRDRVRTVALVSGGAYKLLPHAAKEGVDCFVTGSFDEPAWHMAMEGGINFFALGHSATERIGPRFIGAHLQQQMDLEHTFIDTMNPF